ncbi:hypothetical protein EJC51_08680 [Streptomyces aquilus]|uniref:Uncharacterized protein n=1 Tax=Streptomyces aquilus TaxID=2548456 RepID=A0A3Q9BWR9_9ACTN|nr:hypothetical protein [Streptomyces aquilus]AZP16178.1 hypothetical protein EJC51_08680 [Streptomyces aquilus]
MDDDETNTDAGNLLPSPAAVRVQLTLDLDFQLQVLLTYRRDKPSDTASEIKMIRRRRDSELVERVARVVPPEDFERATTPQGALDIAALEQRYPYVRIMHVMRTGWTVQEVQLSIQNSLRGSED